MSLRVRNWDMDRSIEDISVKKRKERLEGFGWSFGISFFIVVFMWWLCIGSTYVPPSPLPIPKMVQLLTFSPEGDHIIKEFPSIYDIEYRKPIPEKARSFVLLVGENAGDRAYWKGFFREGIFLIATDDSKESAPVGDISIVLEDSRGIARNFLQAGGLGPSKWQTFWFWFLSSLTVFVAFMSQHKAWIYCIGGFFKLVKRSFTKAIRIPLILLSPFVVGSSKELNWDYAENAEAPPEWKDTFWRRLQRRLFPNAYRFDLSYRSLFSSAWIWNNSPKDRHLAFGSVPEDQLHEVLKNTFQQSNIHHNKEASS